MSLLTFNAYYWFEWKSVLYPSRVQVINYNYIYIGLIHVYVGTNDKSDTRPLGPICHFKHKNLWKKCKRKKEHNVKMERGENDSNAYENMKQYMYKYKLACCSDQLCICIVSWSCHLLISKWQKSLHVSQPLSYTLLLHAVHAILFDIIRLYFFIALRSSFPFKQLLFWGFWDLFLFFFLHNFIVQLQLHFIDVETMFVL